jgi:hypothetical protein
MLTEKHGGVIIVPTYRVIGSGPQFPSPYIVSVDSAGEALTRLRATRQLCGQAEVERADGVKLTELQLEREARQEQEANA